MPETLTLPDVYVPENLSRWELPGSYAGAHWDGYYRAPVARAFPDPVGARLARLHTMKTKLTARIFADVGGYFVCDDGLDYLDARGYAHASKADALRAAYRKGYTHAVGSGCYRSGRSIASQIRPTEWDKVARLEAF